MEEPESLHRILHEVEESGSGLPTQEALAHKAAKLLMIAFVQPFHEGNKRTAFSSMLVFLEANGYKLTYGDKEVFDLLEDLMYGRKNHEELYKWLRHKIQRK